MTDQYSKVELNTASASEIAQLPGMTARLAQRIVRRRERNGPYRDLSELFSVPGLSRLSDEFASTAYVNPDAFSSRGLTFAHEDAGSPEAVFTGSPGFLSGDVVLLNPTSSPVFSSTLSIRSDELAREGNLGLAQIQLHTRIDPGQCVRAHLSFAVDPYTSPGVYRADVSLGGERRTIVVNVAEQIRVTVSPDRLVFLNEPGARVEKTVFVTNIGNVTLRAGDVSSVVLEQDNLECRVLRGAVKRLQNPRWDDFVGVVSDEVNRAFTEIEPLRIRVLERPDEIVRGRTATYVLECTLPSSLRAGHSYRGLFRLFDSSVTIVVNPSKPAGGDSQDKPTRRRTTKAAEAGTNERQV